MDIEVTAGIGQGSTTLSAFDAALKKAGVYNYNLIALSSIVPPMSNIKKVGIHNSPANEYGNRLYVIKADIRSQEAGKYIAAALGWYQYDDGRGLFVEHEIIGETKVAAKSEIKQRIVNSLRDLCQFRNLDFDAAKVHSSIAIAQVKDQPTCALVLAIYRSEDW